MRSPRRSFLRGHARTLARSLACSHTVYKSTRPRPGRYPPALNRARGTSTAHAVGLAHLLIQGDMSALSKARTWSTTNGHAASTTATKSTAIASPPSSSSPYTRSPAISTASATNVSTEQKKQQQQQQHTTHITTLTTQYQDIYASSRSRSSSSGTVDNDDPVVVTAPTFLQPRVAAVLGVSKRWHPILFSLRLLSIVPGIILSFPMIIRFLLMLHAFATSEDASDPLGSGRGAGDDRLLLTETMLAIIWVNMARTRARYRGLGIADLGLCLCVFSAVAQDTSPSTSQTASCPDGEYIACAPNL